MINVKDLSITFGNKKIIDNVSYNFQRKNFYVLAGKSGTGKSTLLKAIVNLVQYEGEILFDGNKVTDMDISLLRSKVIYVHQEPILVGETIEEDLEFIYSLKINSKKEFDKNEYLKILNFFGYGEDFLHKKVDELSGGQKSIAAILRSISLKPDFLLLDEPTSAFDMATELRFIDFLKRLKEKIGVIVVTHSYNMIKYADEMVILKHGKIYKYDTIKEGELLQVLNE